MEPPSWAKRLILRVSQDFSIAPPVISWRTRKRTYSLGYCTVDSSEIGVSQGSELQDARMTVLHEMCHLVLLRGDVEYQGEHNEIFYDFLWPFLRHYRFPMKVALAFEASHHKRVVLKTYRRGGGRLKLEV